MCYHDNNLRIGTSLRIDTRNLRIAIRMLHVTPVVTPQRSRCNSGEAIKTGVYTTLLHLLHLLSINETNILFVRKCTIRSFRGL